MMMTRLVNNLKTTVLLALIIVLFMWAGHVVFGGTKGLVLGFLFGGMSNLVAFFFSDKIALMSTGAQPVTEDQAPQLYRIVRNLAEKDGLPMPRIYIAPQDAPNAFATGRNPRHAVVAVTQGILRLCNEQELTGVLAHEMSHVKHRDMLISTIAATMAGAITMLAHLAQWGLIFGGGMGGRDDDRRGGNALGLLLMIIVAPIAAMLIQLAISRSREYEADAAGANLAGNPLWLANALQKLEGYNRRIPMDVNPAESHLFIVQPLTGGGLGSLFNTHPPIEKRVARLEQQAQEMGLTAWRVRE